MTILVLMVPPSLRQSSELFRKLLGYLAMLEPAPIGIEDTRLSLKLDNGSRVISLPGSEGTIRGFFSVSLIIIDEAARIMQSPGLKGCASLVVDQTVVGAPVIDLFRQAELDPVGVLIHGGDKASHEAESWRVPKRDLVGALHVLLQTGRLKVVGELKLGTVLSRRC